MDSQGRLAQLGEHFPYKEGVTGSSPVPPMSNRRQAVDIKDSNPRPATRSAKKETHVIERLFKAVLRGEPERVLELLDSKIEWTPTVWSGEPMYRGHEAVHLWLSQFGEGLEDLDIRVQKVEAREDRGAVLGIVFDTRGDQTFAVEVPWSFEMEGELLRRGRAHGTWEEALRAAGLS